MRCKLVAIFLGVPSPFFPHASAECQVLLVLAYSDDWSSSYISAMRHIAWLMAFHDSKAAQARDMYFYTTLISVVLLCAVHAQLGYSR